MNRRNAIKLVGKSGIMLAVAQPLALFAEYSNSMDSKNYEVIIIGGSYAGLSAAMALGRSLRKTLIIDAGKPCNRQTPHSHNFLTQDGSTPKEIATIAKQQVSAYDTVKFHEGFAVSGKQTETGFEITTAADEVFTAEKLVFATGVKDIMPSIQGFAECWGISVVHCPYCHGYEIKGKKTAIIADGERAFHLASLVNNLTEEITIITSEPENFDEVQLEKLKKHRIKIIDKEISEIKHTNGQLEHIVFADGTTESFECAYASIPFEQHTTIPEKLGCKLTDLGHIEVNFMQQTTQEGIYACGDNSTRMRSVAAAVYAGNVTGAMLNHELTSAHF